MKLPLFLSLEFLQKCFLLDFPCAFLQPYQIWQEKAFILIFFSDFKHKADGQRNEGEKK